MKHIGNFEIDNRNFDDIEIDNINLENAVSDAMETFKKMECVRPRRARKMMLHGLKTRNPRLQINEMYRKYKPQANSLEESQNYEDSEYIENHFKLKKLVGKAKGLAKKAVKSKAFKALAAVSTGGVSLAADKKARQKAGSLAKKAVKSKAFKVLAAVSTGGASLAADKKARQKAGKLAKKGIAVGKKIAKKAGSLIASATVFAPVLPFRPLMTKMIKQKGVPVSKGIGTGDLVKLFHKTVMLKKGEKNQFEHLDDEDVIHMFENNSFEVLEQSENHLVDDALKLVFGVVKFIKGIISKPKTKQQQEIAAEGQAILQDLEDKANASGGIADEEEDENGNPIKGSRNSISMASNDKILGMPKMVFFGIIGVTAIGLIYLIIRKK